MSAAPIVLLHGLGVDHRMWDLQAPALQNLGPTWVPDLPGFGFEPPVPGEERTPEAYADWVASRIRARWPGRPVSVAGYSMGGTFALLLALRHPELVARLVMACSPPFWTRGWRQALRLLLCGPLALAAMEAFQLTVLLGCLRLSRGASQLSAVKEMIRRADRSTMVDLCRALAITDLRGRLGEVSVPALVVSGAHDPWLPAGYARWTAERFSDAKLRVFPGAGHLVCLSRADEFTQTLARFLGGGEAARAERTE